MGVCCLHSSHMSSVRSVLVFADTWSPTALAPSAASLVVVLAEGSRFSWKASPFCCISMVGGELQFVRLSGSITNPSSTTVSSPVCTTPFLFSKDSFNCSFTLSTRKKKTPYLKAFPTHRNVLETRLQTRNGCNPVLAGWLHVEGAGVFLAAAPVQDGSLPRRPHPRHALRFIFSCPSAQYKPRRT